jgi:hypothetical protein
MEKLIFMKYNSSLNVSININFENDEEKKRKIDKKNLLETVGNN